MNRLFPRSSRNTALLHSLELHEALSAIRESSINATLRKNVLSSPHSKGVRMPLLRTIALLLFAVAFQPFGHAQQTGDEAEIRAVLARETDGWNQFDAKKVASTFTQDAIWQNPFGVRLHGAAEIEAFLTGLMARPGYRAGKDTA